jgi:hypothetical protein
MSALDLMHNKPWIYHWEETTSFHKTNATLPISEIEREVENDYYSKTLPLWRIVSLDNLLCYGNRVSSVRTALAHQPRNTRRALWRVLARRRQRIVPHRHVRFQGPRCPARVPRVGGRSRHAGGVCVFARERRRLERPDGRVHQKRRRQSFWSDRACKLCRPRNRLSLLGNLR